MCTTPKSYEDKGVQLFNNKVLRSRSLRERPTKFPVSIILHRRTRPMAGRSAAPLTWKISGQTLCFRASTSCSKIQNGTKYFNTVKNSRAHFVFLRQAQVVQNSWMINNISIQWKISGQLCFSGQAQVSQKSWMWKIYSIQWKISRQTLCFRASASCSKILNVKSKFNTVRNCRASASC